MIRILFVTMITIFYLGCASTGRSIKVHDRTPINIQDMNGSEYQIDQIVKTQNVVLFFWQTWCTNCIAETPLLVKTAEKYKGKIRFFGIISGPNSIIDEQKINRVVTELEVPYPQVRDRNLFMSKRYKITETPTIVVIGKDMEILYNDHELPNWKRFDDRNE